MSPETKTAFDPKAFAASTEVWWTGETSVATEIEAGVNSVFALPDGRFLMVSLSAQPSYWVNDGILELMPGDLKLDGVALEDRSGQLSEFGQFVVIHCKGLEHAGITVDPVVFKLGSMTCLSFD